MRDRALPKVILFIVVIAAITLFYVLGADQYFTLPFIKSKLLWLQQNARDNFLFTAGIFVLIYVLLTSLSIPGTIVLTLLSGAVFGFFLGTLLTMFSATTGATIAFLMARYMFRDFMARKFSRQFQKMDKHMRKEGKVYLLIMRMIPVSPFVVINNVMGLTNMNVGTYYVITFIGMLPGTMIYIYAGLKISQINDVSEILSLPVILSLTAIGLLPMFAKKVVNSYRKKHHMGAIS
jgi:uncharacterized membrane protein YdjX (TVP38/TMEM64 family)